jgi:hypothetical protein
MGLFDLLERTGLVKSTEVDDQEKKPGLGPVKGSEPKVAVAAAVTKSAGIDPAKIAAIDESVRKELTGAVDASGSRFVTELSDTLTTLEDVVDDETKRKETALKLLKKKGVSITDIIGDLDSCIGALKAKDREFRNQLQEMIRVFHADTLLTSIPERTMNFNNNDPMEFNIGDFYQAPEICLDCVKCRFTNVKGARFCASCGAELVAMKNVPAIKLPNVVDVAIKRISETNRLGNRVLLLTTILVRFKEIIGDEGVSPDAKLSEMRQLLVDHKI